MTKQYTDRQRKLGQELLEDISRPGCRPERVRELVRRGASLEEKYKDEYSLLSAALLWERVDLAMLLVELGADPHARTGDGTTLLMEAANYGQAKMVRFLLDLGVSFGDMNDQGDTALSFALAQNHGEIISMLQSEPERRAARDINARRAYIRSGLPVREDKTLTNIPSLKRRKS